MSRHDRFDRADFETRPRRLQPAEPAAQPEQAQPEQAQPAPTNASTPPQPQISASERPIWPIVGLKGSDIGDTVMKDRRGRPHNGIDLLRPAGTAVIAARSGRVLRIVDGRNSNRPKLRRAGLFVDIMGADSLVYRYLHLGTIDDANLKKVNIVQGSPIGTIAPEGTSGVRQHPQLHFEIRRSDYSNDNEDYGPAINPLQVLPSLSA